MKEVEKDDSISYITDEDGKETEIEVVTEFEREENGKTFVVYTLKYPETEKGDPDFYVAEVVTNEDGSEELVDINDEDDMDYCQNVFNEYVEEFLSNNLGDDAIEEEEENLIVS